jgi:hypothetical protein
MPTNVPPPDKRGPSREDKSIAKEEWNRMQRRGTHRLSWIAVGVVVIVLLIFIVSPAIDKIQELLR